MARIGLQKELWVVTHAVTGEVLGKFAGYRAASRHANELEVPVKLVPEPEYVAATGHHIR